MGMVKSDIGGNAGKIQKNVTDASKTLEEMVDAEIAAAGGDVKKATKEGSTGLALLWLKRCGPHPTRANPQHDHGRAWPWSLATARWSPTASVARSPPWSAAPMATGA